MFRVRIVALCAGAVAIVAPLPASAQTTGSQPVGPFPMPPVTVTATKEPAEVQKLPISVTAIDEATLDRGGVTTVSEAAVFAPNTFFSELSARKVSNATFRGIGSSPANAGVTTFIDGVPQLNTISSNLSLSGVGQIEFVRGPESALFGRNTLGGLINITSRKPVLTNWGGGVWLPFGSEDSRSIQGQFSGPIKSDRLALGVA